jgi:hypothetical protein
VTVTSSNSDPVAAACGADEGAEEGAGVVVGALLKAGRGGVNVTCGGATKTCGAAAVPVTPSGPLPDPGEGAGVCAAHTPRNEAHERMMQPVTVLISPPSASGSNFAHHLLRYLTSLLLRYLFGRIQGFQESLVPVRQAGGSSLRRSIK